MRHLLQPRVLKLAAIAALTSVLACYPRLALWLHPPAPIWYLAATLFICGIMLWSFVFAWHVPYAKSPVFKFKLEHKSFLAVTLLGVVVAMVYHFCFDPALRSRLPEEYPADLRHWLAATLFSLAFNQLFLLFAPCDWLLRLSQNRWAAMSLTALFGTGVLALKLHALAAPVAPLLLAALLAAKFGLGLIAVSFYLRGGVLLVWWWALLLESRHLLTLLGQA